MSDFDPFGDPNQKSIDKKINDLSSRIQKSRPHKGDNRPTVIESTNATKQEGATKMGPRPVPRRQITVEPDSYTPSGPNPLVNAATTLLNLILSLKNTHTYPDIEGLRNQLITEVNNFKHSLEIERSRISYVTIENASYLICAALDDVIINDTAWGSTSIWPQKSLLATIHNDFQGGTHFYELLDDSIRLPAINRDILELMYLCLSLGFQGQYRRQHLELESRRKILFDTLYALRRKEEPDQDLSPHWQSEVKKPNTLIHYIPFWVMAVVTGALLVAIYTIFLFRLNIVAEPVEADFDKVAVTAPDFSRGNGESKLIPEDDKGAYIRLRAFLSPEISQHLVELEQLPEGVLIRLHGDDLFKSASATLNPNYSGLLERIGKSLKDESGKVLVTGHTDNVPIQTLKFPSNYVLSKARAESVAKSLIASAGTSNRFLVKGKGAFKPLSSNEDATGRARNRRVEIILMAGIK